WMLQGSGVEAGFERALLRERAGDALYAWLDPAGGRWDAALDGSQTPAVALPGLPAIVVGSNGAVAWGFTNAYGQWFDWIKLPKEVAAGTLHQVDERIEVKGGEAVTLAVQALDSAPVVRQHDGQAYALRWIAHQGEAFNLALDGLLQARSVEEATAIAQRSGMPHQNIVIADRSGHIAWTIAGKLWAEPAMAQRHARFQPPDTPPHGWLAPADYPRLADPANGQLWTANNRQLGGAAGGALIGDGGFDLGARAQQIRDRLGETPRFDEARLGALHHDDEARFMQAWARRIATVAARSPRHAPVAELLAQWNGRADADQAGYRLARAVRLKTLDQLWAAWSTPLLGPMQADPKRRMPWRNMFEYPATQALDQRPAHLLPPAFASWDALLLAQVDAAVQEMTQDGRRPLAQAAWGEANSSRIQHVLSRAVPVLARWLDMPQRPQSGDANLPHVAQPAFGQSQRLVVSPGHEEQATLSMPGGQSGHPMSPYYGAGHEAWVAGRATPLLAGPAQHRLGATP
ncbi:MAG TPA: penicillin acylase family protein, partial [Ideonella sp.]|nr:penicillin acylase family protein [Ideonella sp.]